MGKFAHGTTVVLLIEEEPGLLAVLEVKVVGNAILACNHAGAFRNRPVALDPPALLLRKALLETGRRVVSLVDATDVLTVCAQHVEQQRVERGAQTLHANGSHLRDKYILVAVND